MDVGMPVDDYKKFLLICQDELDPRYFLQNRSTDEHFREMFSKIRVLNTLFVEKHESDNEPYQQGIYLDIFPYEKYPYIPVFVRQFFFKKTARLHHSLFIRKNEKNFNPYEFLKYFVYRYCLAVFGILHYIKLLLLLT